MSFEDGWVTTYGDTPHDEPDGKKKNNNTTTAAVLALAGTVAVADGPLPVGDAIGAGILAGYSVYKLGEVIVDLFSSKSESKVVSESNTKTNEDDYRVRIQVQGGGVEKSSAYVGKVPMTTVHAIIELNKLKCMLTSRELKNRSQAFEKAESWLMSVKEAGGAGPGTSKTFNSNGVNPSKARVDIEIWKGINFTK